MNKLLLLLLHDSLFKIATTISTAHAYVYIRVYMLKSKVLISQN